MVGDNIERDSTFPKRRRLQSTALPTTTSLLRHLSIVGSAADSDNDIIGQMSKATEEGAGHGGRVGGSSSNSNTVDYKKMYTEYTR